MIYIFNKGINEYAEPIKYIVRELIEENNEISSSSSSSDDNKNTESSFTQMTTKYFSNKLFEYIVKVIGQHDNSNNNSATTTTTTIDAKQQILKLIFTKHNQYGFLPLITILEIDSEQIFDILSNIYYNSITDGIIRMDNLLSYIKMINKVIVDGKADALMNAKMDKVQLYTSISKYFSIFIGFIYKNGIAIDIKYVVDSLIELSKNNSNNKISKCEDAIKDILKKYRDEVNNNDNGTARSKNDDEEQKVDLNRIITDIPQFKYQLKELKYTSALAVLHEIEGNFKDALESFLNNSQNQIQAFRYALDIHAYLIRENNSNNNNNDGDSTTATNTSAYKNKNSSLQKFHKIILNNLKRFSEIDRVKTTDMIMEIFGSDSDSLADILNGIDDEFLQYNCLQQIIKTQNNNRRNSNHNISSSNNDNLIMMNGNDDDDDDDNGFHNNSMHMHSGNNIDNNNNNNT